ncbi:MAG: hypothetical protein EOO10_04855, partial [Chitinophagaceae bacterium]
MTKHFSSFEDVIADENFLAWYAGKSTEKANAWQDWLKKHPESQLLVDEAVSYLKSIQVNEKQISALQV